MDNNTTKTISEKNKKEPSKTKKTSKLKPISFAFKPDNHYKNFIDEFFSQEFIVQVLPTGEK